MFERLYFHEVTPQYSSKKVQSTAGKNKREIIFSNQGRSYTCSKVVINEPGRCPTKSDNIYFANNEQALLAFTAAFCFAHVKHNSITFKLYILIDQRKLLTLFWRLCETQANQ